MKADHRRGRFWSATLGHVFESSLQGFPDRKLKQLFLFPHIKIKKASWMSLHIQFWADMSSLCLSPPGGVHTSFQPKVLRLLHHEAESGLTYLFSVCVTKLYSWCAAVVVVIWQVWGMGNMIKSACIWPHRLSLGHGHLYMLFSPSSYHRFRPQAVLS